MVADRRRLRPLDRPMGADLSQLLVALLNTAPPALRPIRIGIL